MEQLINKRLDDTILYILDAAKKREIDNLSKFQLMKLLYLIEVESQKYVGEPFIQSVRFFREKNGPISADIYHSLNRLREKGSIDVWIEKNEEYGYPRHCHRIKKGTSKISLSKPERIFLNSVLENYIALPMNRLKSVVYSTEPMLEIRQLEKSTRHPMEGRPLNLGAVSLDEDVLEAIAS